MTSDATDDTASTGPAATNVRITNAHDFLAARAREAPGVRIADERIPPLVLASAIHRDPCRDRLIRRVRQ